jgi:hypothetical protein
LLDYNDALVIFNRLSRGFGMPLDIDGKALKNGAVDSGGSG